MKRTRALKNKKKKLDHNQAIVILKSEEILQKCILNKESNMRKRKVLLKINQ